MAPPVRYRTVQVRYTVRYRYRTRGAAWDFSGTKPCRASTWTHGSFDISRASISAYRTETDRASISTARRQSLQKISVLSMTLIISKQTISSSVVDGDPQAKYRENVPFKQIRLFDSPRDTVAGIDIDFKACLLASNPQGSSELRYCSCCLCLLPRKLPPLPVSFASSSRVVFATVTLAASGAGHLEVVHAP